MNIQPGRKNLAPRTSSARKDPAFLRQFLRVMGVMLCFVLIASVVFVHIYMNQRITETGREIRAVKRNISLLNIELSNLNNRYEQSSSPAFIARQMKRFGLKLVPAEPGQVRRMALLSVSQARQRAAYLNGGKNRRSYSLRNTWQKQR